MRAESATKQKRVACNLTLEESLEYFSPPVTLEGAEITRNFLAIENKFNYWPEIPGSVQCIYRFLILDSILRKKQPEIINDHFQGLAHCNFNGTIRISIYFGQY